MNSMMESRYKELRTRYTYVNPNFWYRAVSQRAPVSLAMQAAAEGRLIHNPKPVGPEI